MLYQLGLFIKKFGGPMIYSNKFTLSLVFTIHYQPFCFGFFFFGGNSIILGRESLDNFSKTKTICFIIFILS